MFSLLGLVITCNCTAAPVPLTSFPRSPSFPVLDTWRRTTPPEPKHSTILHTSSRLKHNATLSRGFVEPRCPGRFDDTDRGVQTAECCEGLKKPSDSGASGPASLDTPRCLHALGLLLQFRCLRRTEVAKCTKRCLLGKSAARVSLLAEIRLIPMLAYSWMTAGSLRGTVVGNLPPIRR